MNNRRYRHRLLALSASILLGLSGLSSSAVDAAEVTVEQPAADTTVSQDTGNPSADTKEAAEGQTEGETTEPERIEPDAYFEPIQSNDTANWPQGPAVWAESAVVMDLDSGTFLYSKNMDVAKYPASITKILTTLIAIEYENFYLHSIAKRKSILFIPCLMDFNSIDFQMFINRNNETFPSVRKSHFFRKCCLRHRTGKFQYRNPAWGKPDYGRLSVRHDARICQ